MSKTAGVVRGEGILHKVAAYNRRTCYGALNDERHIAASYPEFETRKHCNLQWQSAAGG